MSNDHATLHETIWVFVFAFELFSLSDYTRVFKIITQYNLNPFMLAVITLEEIELVYLTIMIKTTKRQIAV